MDYFLLDDGLNYSNNFSSSKVNLSFNIKSNYLIINIIKSCLVNPIIDIFIILILNLFLFISDLCNFFFVFNDSIPLHLSLTFSLHSYTLQYSVWCLWYHISLNEPYMFNLVWVPVVLPVRLMAPLDVLNIRRALTALWFFWLF